MAGRNPNLAPAGGIALRFGKSGIIDCQGLIGHMPNLWRDRADLERVQKLLPVDPSLAPSANLYSILPFLEIVLARVLSSNANANASSRSLANRSLLQSVVTSIPLLAADFFTLWGLLFATTAFVERLCGLPHNLVTFETAVVASLLLVPISQLAGLYPALGTSAAVEFRQLVQSAGTALCIFSGIGIVADPANGPYFIAASLLTLLLAVPSLPAARFTARCIACKRSSWGAPCWCMPRRMSPQTCFAD